MISFNDYCRSRFGEKLYKISLNAGMSCPNRDGKLGFKGCIFCSEGGSGDFAADPADPMDIQIEKAKARVSGKYNGSRFIAYFQAFTNTYAPVDVLENIFFPVITREDIAAISIATRPDCLEDEKLELIYRLNKVKPVFVELGLQTTNDRSAEYIRRGYKLEIYDKAVTELESHGIHTVTHVILGLPGETRDDMLRTVEHVVKTGGSGIKLQLLHVLKGTDLAGDFEKGLFQVLTLDEYVSILKDCCSLLPGNMVVHRLTGDGPKSLLIAPKWSSDKKRVLNRIKKELTS